jgi:hypothetical protein
MTRRVTFSSKRRHQVVTTIKKVITFLSSNAIALASLCMDGKCISPTSESAKTFARDDYLNITNYIAAGFGSLVDSVKWKSEFKAARSARVAIPVPSQIVAVGEQLVIYKMGSELASELGFTGETAKATERLRFLLDTHLITDPETRGYIEAYINTPQIINPPAIAAPTTPPPSTTRRVTVETGRLGGGHNQRDECARLQAQVESQNPGQRVNLVGTSEDSDKDFLGHVTYNYHCTFDITRS